MHATAGQTPHRYHTLDAMRGVAALLVVTYHLQQRWHDGAIAGYLAVDLFFALSGFVIALNYSERFAHSLTTARFIELRLIRLFPLYALGFALGLAKLATGYILHIPPAASVGSVPCAALFGAAMLPDPCSPELFPLNGPSWSLFLELAINLAFALFLWRAGLTVLVTLMIVSALSLMYLIAPPDYFNAGWAWHNLPGGVARTIFSFCAGIVLYRLLPYARRRQSHASLLPIVGMAAIIGVAAPQDYRVPFEIIVVVLIFPALIFAGCLLESPSRIARTMSGFLGDLSYPIYAIHWPLIAIIVPIAAKLNIPGSLSTMLFLILLLPVAFVASQLDRIVRRRLSARLQQRRATSVAIAEPAR